LYAKLRKYELWLKKVVFLGYVILGEEIFMDLKKVMVVLK
jgi:hypothetical protein